jgi:hypothetical protein
MDSLLFKACITGFVFIVLGLMMDMVFQGLKVQLPNDCAKWDDNYIMEASLFAMGFVFRYALQIPAFSSFVL